MILISIPWYEGLQIKLACYKIFNIKRWIHLDVFAVMDNGKTVKHQHYGVYEPQKPRDSTFSLQIC